MGLADWITGTKCADCGLKIQGPKFSRVIFGSEMWVCGSCEEKRKTERKNERDAAEQRRNQDAGAAFRGRSDADIAEVMARSTLREYAAFVKEVSDITGGDIQANPIPAFMFVLFTQATIVLRGISNSQFDGERVARIHDLLVRYALAQIIHH